MLWNSIFFVIFSLVSVERCEAERTRKLVGKMAIFNCPYDTAYKDSPKYLKKRDHNVSITLIRSDGWMGWTTVGRYKLNDDKNSGKFDVHIFPLTLNDTGTYVCGVEAAEDRDGQETKLEVHEETEPTKARVAETTTFPPVTVVSIRSASPAPGDLVQISTGVAVVAAAVLVFTLILLYIQKTKRSDRPSEGPQLPLSLTMTSNEITIPQENIYAEDTTYSQLAGSDVTNPPVVSSQPMTRTGTTNQRLTNSQAPIYSLFTFPNSQAPT
ncbi:uncharacterized protein LOC122128747 [Clupea harengus]|uniref:Uncharacterized protein LOC122128747 n=1 Tax=Clupea harengus TaxID=7950 RepID=A0A8M1K696_CLUHA|nr:uncharacterized protein LOC122128747 [Clupea harengus]